MMRRARSLPLALAIAGIIAWLPTRGVPQETRETTDSSAEHAAASIGALFETVLGETVSSDELPRDRAIRLVHEKIKADKRLQGGYYEFQAKKRLLNEVELQRGRKELRRMLRDRPKMARGLTAKDELFQWAVRKFAGEDLPTWIEWRKTSDDPYGFEASHRPPTDRAPGAVFVGEARVPYLLQWKGNDHSFDTLWCHAAFELHNIHIIASLENFTAKQSPARLRETTISWERPNWSTTPYYARDCSTWKCFIPGRRSDPSRQIRTTGFLMFQIPSTNG